jgi:hypothetical protein
MAVNLLGIGLAGLAGLPIIPDAISGGVVRREYVQADLTDVEGRT